MPCANHLMAIVFSAALGRGRCGWSAGAAGALRSPSARAARQGTAGVARHGPEGARRRLRPDRLRSQAAQLHQREANSERARARLGPPQRLAYGPSAIEALDMFATKRPNAPINMFIHGGAWRQGSPRICVPPSCSSTPARISSCPISWASAGRRQPDADGRAGAPRGRLGLQERRELRRRSQPHPCHRPVVGRPSRRRRW